MRSRSVCVGLWLLAGVACGDLESGETSNDADGGAGDGGGADSAGGAAPTSGYGAADAVGGFPPVGPCDGFATEVLAIEYGSGAGFGQEHMPEIVLGAPHGGGPSTGSLHVLALGNGGSITLGFGEQLIEDAEGPDFIVFENAFYAGGDPESPFAELATVEVSLDGETWSAFPCTASEHPYGSCAGWHPVLAGAPQSSDDPHDPTQAGGDAFDLADVGLTSARFVRITDRADTTGLSGSFDLDAIALVSWSCDAR